MGLAALWHLSGAGPLCDHAVVPVAGVGGKSLASTKRTFANWCSRPISVISIAALIAASGLFGP